MTLTEAQPKRDRSITEGHCCAFCCAPLLGLILYNFKHHEAMTDHIAFEIGRSKASKPEVMV